MLVQSRFGSPLPISTVMHPADAYGEDDHDDLPELPIPRPGEWSPAAAAQQQPQPQPQPLQAPRLGGGASFTAAGGDEGGGDDLAPPVAPAPPIDREQLEVERFTWDLAATLTSGMLANPARNHSSVKDAMGLFDQFLQEMHAYRKIASEFDLLAGDAERRRSHEEYFHRNGAAPGAGETPPTVATGPSAVPAKPAPPKPEPAQPRPLGEYRPIPPGMRGPYSPGSMAGTPPPTEPPAGSDGEQAA